MTTEIDSARIEAIQSELMGRIEVLIFEYDPRMALAVLAEILFTLGYVACDKDIAKNRKLIVGMLDIYEEQVREKTGAQG